ncbi:tripartite motif-containing protein 16-like [Xiphophorus hellerii]|uniref:tripartite motif-containing protein 16-like n=1 Tax=Xiphophorus hellerii TaxID=8084 RepID=UPI0013B37C69|nr:tripartite motif-containing protein 16-like [Xiphophorus hellerii]XP_032430037.1 tripartite motif-containing protein 16-like [Xiphophorus hellerii]XP_032430038.1 tripartite motif-containing protein 16-like [Xiphophorus hellerii]XP_032430039.1 tripartite motif-containing protein 16-like [Xiphophorus hellerii]
MASGGSLLTEEHLLCPICLDVFNKPVSTPCGHNFCLPCITCYWDTTLVCQCPICKEDFPNRPNLKVNIFIADLLSQFKSLHVLNVHTQRSAGQQPVSCGSEVQCDICSGQAVKSCLDCVTSYCDSHLQPHGITSELKRHTLVEPVESLGEKVCRKHHRLMMLFCRKENSVLCDLCVGLRHANHDVVSVKRGYNDMTYQVVRNEAKVQRMIQERMQKVQSTKESLIQGKTDTKKLIENGSRDLTKLVAEIKRTQEELIKVFEEKQKAAENQATGLITDMEKEISCLKVTAKNLEELKEIKDPVCFLKRYPNQSLLPHTMDLSTHNFIRHLEVKYMHKSVRNSISQLQDLLGKLNEELNRFSNSTDTSNKATLRYMQQYGENIVLDFDTAHPMLTLSADGKQVWYNMGTGLWGNQIPKPNMFTQHLAVVGQRGFSSRRFYFEVHVGQKTEWCLGVASASLQKNGAIVRSPNTGLWAIWFLVDKFETFSSPGEVVCTGKVEHVGVFVDYNGGQVSFFDVVTAVHIYSFTECLFTEELYPYFNPCDNEYGSNLDPMIIVPVSSAE